MQACRRALRKQHLEQQLYRISSFLAPGKTWLQATLSKKEGSKASRTTVPSPGQVTGAALERCQQHQEDRAFCIH